MANISAGLIPDHLLTRMDQELSPDNPLNRDVRDLAGLLGFTNDEISYICMKRHAFKYMLDQWSKRDCVNSTLENLKTSLLELKRLDVVELVDEAVTEINNASYDRLEELVVLQNEREDNASGFASLTVSAQTYSDDTSSVEVEKKISVFIVYYPENEEYMQSVHELVAFLHESYIDVKVDLYDALRNSQSLPLFALSNLRNCDFVLVLCSESVKYSEQLLNNKAVELSEKMKELVFIMKQIIGDLYRRMQVRCKYIPVLLATSTSSVIPKFLKVKGYIFPSQKQLLLQQLFSVARFISSPQIGFSAKSTLFRRNDGW